MEEIKWKEEIYAKDFLSQADPRIQAILDTNIGLLAIAIGKTKEDVLNYPYSVFIKLFDQFTKRYGLAGMDDFLGIK